MEAAAAALIAYRGRVVAYRDVTDWRHTEHRLDIWT